MISTVWQPNQRPHIHLVLILLNFIFLSVLIQQVFITAKLWRLIQPESSEFSIQHIGVVSNSVSKMFTSS